MIWYRKLGYHNNPFSIKPAFYENSLVAYDMSHVYDKIDKGEMVFLEGEYGTGKTTMLKNIISRFRGRNRIIYFSFNTGQFNMKELLEGANTFLRRMAGLQVKNIIMLLDEVQGMTNADVKQLLKHYQEGTIKSIVFVSHDYDIVKFPEEIDSYLNGNILRTVDLSNAEAIALIRRRIGDIDLLSDKMIIKLFKLSGKNPRRLFAYCEDVVRYAVEIGDTEVTDFHVKEVLGNELRKPKAQKVKKAKKSKEPQKPEIEEPEIEVKEMESTPDLEKPIEVSKEKVSTEKKEPKFKVNKLVEGSKNDGLGRVMAKEHEAEKVDDSEVPEYKVYFYN